MRSAGCQRWRGTVGGAGGTPLQTCSVLRVRECRTLHDFEDFRYCCAMASAYKPWTQATNLDPDKISLRAGCVWRVRQAYSAVST